MPRTRMAGASLSEDVNHAPHHRPVVMDAALKALRFSEERAMSEHDYFAAAHRGAAELDIVRPGWFRDINLFTLDLSEPDLCILGQLWGWEEGTRQMDCQYERERQNAWGFDVPEEMYRGLVSKDLPFELLTRAWKDEINQRLNAS